MVLASKNGLHNFLYAKGKTFNVKVSKSGGTPTPTPTPTPVIGEVVVDNTDSACTFDAAWASSTYYSDFYGTDYAQDGTSGADASKWAVKEKQERSEGRNSFCSLLFCFNFTYRNANTINKQRLIR